MTLKHTVLVYILVYSISIFSIYTYIHNMLYLFCWFTDKQNRSGQQNISGLSPADLWEREAIHFCFLFFISIVKVRISAGCRPTRNVMVKLRVGRMKAGHSRVTLRFDPTFMNTRWSEYLNQERDNGGGGGGCFVVCESINDENG